MWLRKISGRAVPSPLTRAYRFALPGLGSNSCASIPSRASTVLSQRAALISFPGGVRRVDGDVLRQQRRRLLPHGPPLRVALGDGLAEQLRGKKDRLGGWTDERRRGMPHAAREKQQAETHRRVTTHESLRRRDVRTAETDRKSVV